MNALPRLALSEKLAEWQPAATEKADAVDFAGF